MTHSDLVRRAARWLRNSQRCGVVLTEFSSASREVPDAIGWGGGWRFSYLVECKTSIGDFYADKKKPGRCGTRAYAGIGRFRYYLTPPGLLSAELIRKHRPRWGLIEAKPKTIRTVLEAEPFSASVVAIREAPLLYSYARRIAQYGLTLDEAQDAVRNAAEREWSEMPRVKR